METTDEPRLTRRIVELERGRGVWSFCGGFEEVDGVEVDGDFCGVGDAPGGEDLAEGGVKLVNFFFGEETEEFAEMVF